MANLKYGSTGDEVKQLQEALGFTGSDVDGIFGKKTQQAVIDYQTNNGLAVDGIAGEKTLGKLYGTSNNNGTAAGAGSQDTNAGTGGDTGAGFTYDSFQHESFDATGDEQINQAWDILQQNNASKPGSYTSVWQDEADSYLSQYQNRDPFSYDFNADALYQQYKDQYIQQGQMAMMDTMGQAAAMTGGYGNSYAQTAGQQMYNQYLGQLNAVIPELYQMAYDRYTQEGQELLAMYDLYMGRENQEYGRYQDSLSNWYQEDARLTNNYNTLYDRKWNEYLEDKTTAREDYLTGRSEAFDAWQTQQNQKFQSEEAQKDRDFTASENEKSRAASRSSSSVVTEKPVTASLSDLNSMHETLAALSKRGQYDAVASRIDEWERNKIIDSATADSLYAMYGIDPNKKTTDTSVMPNMKIYGGGGGGGTSYIEPR